MWESVIAAIAGLASVFMQNSMNRDNMREANAQSMMMSRQLNSQQYDFYNSPEARAAALSRAGVSDAGIGAALSGYTGQSGITLTSQPIQPTSIGSTLSDLFSSLQNAGDLERKKKETEIGVDYNKSQIKLTDAQIKKLGVETGLKGMELNLFKDTYQNMVAKSLLDNEVLASQHNLNDALRNNANADVQLKKLEAFLKSGIMDSEIERVKNSVKLQQKQLKLTDAQVDQITANIRYLEIQGDAIEDLEDVRKKEAAEADFYRQFYIDSGVTYGVVKDTAEVGAQIIEAILSVFKINNSTINRMVKTYSK